jgi:hypothetical protein
VEELNAFNDIALASKESTRVPIPIKSTDLTIVTADGRRIVEPCDLASKLFSGGIFHRGYWYLSRERLDSV